MNFNLLVLIVTVFVYIILKMYYNKNDNNDNNDKNDKKKHKRSRLIYVLVVPLGMYFYKYISNKPNVDIDNINDNINNNVIKSASKSSSSDIKSESLLTSLFPESSINVSTSSM